MTDVPAGLLRGEYPDEMADASCSCEPDAVCGAHRLFHRYEGLWNALREANAEKRRLRGIISGVVVALGRFDDRLDDEGETLRAIRATVEAVSDRERR